MRPLRIAALLLATATTGPAHATLGLFEHGNGIMSLGMGGVGYSFAEESMGLAANPAHALALGDRYDIGVDMFIPKAISSFQGNTLAPDDAYESDGRGFYYIPQAGISKRLSDRWAIGVTMLSAGLGPDYDGSPYQRFGGADRAMLSLASTSFVSALAYRVAPAQAVGVGINVGYQSLSVEGLEFLATPAASVSPRHVTNQGKDGAFNVSFSGGWHGQITPWLAAGFGYRSKNFTQRHKDYRGLISEGGKLELPAIFGGGFTLTPIAGWTFSVEGQRYDYRKQRAFRNGLSRFSEGALLGSDSGPGFGFNDQNALKLGVRWQAHPRLALRAGYITASQIVDENETFFAAFGCVTPTVQYSIGATWSVRSWELSGYGFNAPQRSVRGENSIPESFGGGEANISDEVFGWGFSIGRRFGGA